MEKTSKLFLLSLLTISLGCQNNSNTMKNLKISEQNKRVSNYVVDHAVIAHRGSTYWTPEETEAAYRWARNIGADYLEVDIQRSKDGVLLALHDNNLKRTTDCKLVFPMDSICNTGNYTYQELMQLDAGNWFNQAFPKRSNLAYSADAVVRKSNQKAYSFSGKNLSGELDTASAILHPGSEIYVGGKQYISTLEDVLMIAKGWRIARNERGERLYNLIVINSKPHYQFFYVKDREENGNRPGVYIETKKPNLYLGVETDLYSFLQSFAWNIIENPAKADEPYYKNGQVNTGNTNGKVVLQTFSPKSLQNLNSLFKGKVPTCFLLWLGDPNMLKADSATYLENIEFAIRNNANFIGPSIAGEPNNYPELLEKWQADLIHQTGLKIHAYSFDTRYQTEHYANRMDAMFTNRSELTIQFYKKHGLKLELPQPDAIQTLKDLGY